jgi:hypothetical protein
MQRREILLLIALIAAVLVWQGGRIVSKVIFEPIEMRRADLAGLDESIGTKQVEQARLARAERQLRDWRARSLSRDPLVAQRLYQRWLTDLAQNAGFANLKVTPERRIDRNEAYTTVEVSVSGEATLAQTGLFLYRFYRTNLLHRVTTINLQGKDNQGDPLLKVSLTAEGLSLTNAPDRKQLFPQTTLTQPLQPDDMELPVESPLRAAAGGDFLIRIGGEYLTVDGVSGRQWPVRERQVDGASPAVHETGTLIEIIPVDSARQSRSFAALQALVPRNPFAVPTPVKEEPPPVAEDEPQPPPIDVAAYTYLTGVIEHGDDRQALLFDRLNNRRLVVAEGQPFSVAGIEGIVVRIGADHMVFRQGDASWRLKVGENLRSLKQVQPAAND